MRELAAETEAKASRAVGAMTPWIEQEIQAVATSSTTTSRQKTRSAVDRLHEEIRSHLSQNRAGFDKRQVETAETIARISAELSNLTEQLIQFKPASGS